MQKKLEKIYQNEEKYQKRRVIWSTEASNIAVFSLKYAFKSLTQAVKITSKLIFSPSLIASIVFLIEEFFFHHKYNALRL